MKINNFSKYIFWSYKEDADLPDEIVIRQVLLYGEVKDMLLISKLYTKDAIHSVLVKFGQRENKRRYFIEKVILS